MGEVGDAGGLVALYSQLECARAAAATGAFAEGRSAYARAEAALHKVSSAAAPESELMQSWTTFARALRDEQELVAAWEAECAELVAWADSEQPAHSYTPARGGAASTSNTTPPPAAFSVDTRSFEVGELTPPPPRQYTPASSAPQHDPDVWSSPSYDTPPGCFGPPPPLPPGYGPNSGRQHSCRERQDAYERQRRESVTPPGGSSAKRGGGGSSNPFSGVKARVNTGKRAAAGGGGGCGGGMDPKVAVLDMMLDRYSAADQELIQQLSRDVLDQTPGISWDDIAGLEDAKQVLRENVSMPLLFPDLFTRVSCMRPLKGVLLFGPPGTGKTMLAKAVATAGSTAECRTNFINVSASTLASKYRGESEKLVRLTFEIARAVQPCVVFIDEVDSLCSERGSQNEHEASRRMKTELLTQIDGMHSEGGGDASKRPRVMVLAATNYPWAIDEALRRRLEKRIHIPLPQLEEREAMLRLRLKNQRVARDVDLHGIARRTEGYSGDDITNLVSEAGRCTTRRLWRGRDLTSMPVAEVQALERGIIKYMEEVGVGAGDFEYALQRSNPSCSAEDVERHATFADKHGCI